MEYIISYTVLYSECDQQKKKEEEDELNTIKHDRIVV